jgi:hypothetical protein
MPYIVEYWHKTRYKELPYTVSKDKASLQKEVDKLNNSLDKEITKLIPVKVKYRIKKIRNSDVKEKPCEPVPSDV